MGFALPAAIGAKFGALDRTVVAIIGDGRFPDDFAGIRHNYANRHRCKDHHSEQPFPGYGRQWQELFNERRYSFVDIQSPDFVRLASAYNIPGKKIDNRTELPAVLNEMLSTKGSFLLEVMVTKENNVFPMVPQDAVWPRSG